MLMEALTDRSRPAARSAASVRHYLPGGCENGGGIGRLVGYIIETAKETGAKHFVTDTRGARWSKLTSPARLVGAILTMAKDRIVTPDRIHHIHIAGRGSTSRKLILAEAARLLGCCHILHLHDYDYAGDFAQRSPRQQRLIRRMFQNADRVVALGQRDRATLTTLLGVDERRAVVAHNCVPDPGTHNICDGGTPLIVFLGRLSERKGVTELLSALNHPLMKELRWRAVLAGDGPVEHYRRLADAMALSDRVEMPGWLDAGEARALCARADILVLPSHAEGLAMAVLEGLSHGLAVVTTRVGAHEEVITDGETGIFVPVGDQNALGAALAKLVSDRELCIRLSVQGRAHYVNYFSMMVYMRSLEKLYETVSAKHQGWAAAR
ncbi:glycosyltransferase family 4 protein [Rhizobium lentis]|uniref:Glycosyltransferase involved in cell wall biosynthesis n=1 Tax=Rhizobium lentis TaxID=1138194 RepID=A0A7W8UN89_9HYPH|nr:glycosyltransferase family 4 protein [Rhizobium lentis]MBB4574862.1 glycosyltransferase involved in cell wall biosynthesis [Rhizobium lentis]MBB5550789.1 glycosyltransferase involved in cell wall biosynthesis [Rhizobium lentis]MBB5561089.1 glycosyltransferase involved in cell wall biosynthesis [Rhizobium lentis]MBB5567908.1 glycosyltransferase involved in cell wall biosynthesis [Rhizobium lentis]